MSLLNFPLEVSLQLIQKMNIVDRINLSMTHTRLSAVCFDRLLQRNSTKTLTLNELCQLYEQSRTENEKDQCFKSNVLNRLLIKNFNEVVRLYMDPKYDQLVTNGKILHSLGGKFILKGEKEKFSPTFVKKFLWLLEKAEGTLFLAFVDVESFGTMNTKRCARILSSKLERGQKIYCVDYNLQSISWKNNCIAQIIVRMDNFLKFTIYYKSYLVKFYPLNDTGRRHGLCIGKRNSVANTKEFVDLIDGDSIVETKQHLTSVLALVEAAELQGGGRSIMCGNCYSYQVSSDERLVLGINEPDWFNCAGCELK